MEQHVVIGLDLGITAASEMAVACGTELEATRRVASTPTGLTEGLRRAAKGRPVAIVVEATAMAWLVAAVAALRAGVDHTLYRVSAAKSAALRSFYRARTKTDRIDARVLARMPAVDEALLIFTLPEPGELALKRLVLLRHKLVVEKARISNRVRSTLHWAAPGLVRRQKGSLCLNAGLGAVLKRWPDLRALARARPVTIARTTGWTMERAREAKAAVVESVAFYDSVVDFGDLALEFEVVLSQLGSIQLQLDRLERRIATLYDQLHSDDPLLSVPGIGPVVAGIVRATVGDLRRFANLASFRAYTGLVPRESSSGNIQRRGRISKAGPSILRWALYMAADVARYWDPDLAALYRRLMVERGRTHPQALCAVASHLASRIWAVARQGREYEWRDLDGTTISREEAHALASSLAVDPQTRTRLRALKKGGRDASQPRQPKAPQNAAQPSVDKVIEVALEVAARA